MNRSALVTDADAARFAQLVKAHNQSLYAFALKLCGDSVEAHDLVQDALERGLRSFASFDASTNARAWLSTILYNLFIDRSRKRKIEAVKPLDQVDVAAEEPLQPPAWTNISSEQLRAALAQLDGDFRVVCELRVIEQLSYDEIARRTGVPRNTVATRLSRGREKLRAILEQHLAETPR
jgi:RNA polymerase sigma-70 factor (ECF subfamily)